MRRLWMNNSLEIHLREKRPKRQKPHEIFLNIHEITARKLGDEYHHKHRQPKGIRIDASAEEKVKFQGKLDQHPDNSQFRKSPGDRIGDHANRKSQAKIRYLGQLGLP